MQVLLVGPGGAALRVGPGQSGLAVSGSGSGGGASAVWSGLLMSDVSPGNLAAWWDAGSLAGMRDAGGAVPTVWGGPVFSLADKSGNARPASISATGLGNRAPTGPLSMPRAVGPVGGIIARKDNSAGTYWPAIDETVNITAPSVDMRPSVAWSLTAVFSRPNLAQDSTYDGSSPVLAIPVTVLSVAGTPVLRLTANSISDTLKLFPAGANVTVATGLTRLFTHSVTLVNRPGAGVDVWFDDALVATGVANPVSAAGTLGLPSGVGQMIFHEAALWAASLSTADLDRLHGTRTDAAAKRWARANNRKSPAFIVQGQSNFSDMLTFGGGAILAEAVRYHLGLLACTIHVPNGALGAGTGSIVSTGGADVLTGDPNADAVAGNYPLGARGQAVADFLAALDADRRANVAGFLELWSEGASAGYSYSYIVSNLVNQERQMAARFRTAAGSNIPWFLPYAVPYPNNDASQQGIVEMNAAIVANAGNNAFICLPQFLDTLPKGASYDPSTGAFGTAATGGVGGDPAHRDLSEWPRMARRMAPTIARVLAAQSYAESASWPSGLAVSGGPRVVSAVYEGTAQGRTSGGAATDTLLVTVAHDAGYAAVSGCDFYLTAGALGYLDNGTPRPSAAAQGAGWMVQDGGTSSAPTIKLLAVGCERVDATHLRVVLAARLSSTSRANLALARLYYGWGCDNAGSVAAPSQFGRGGAIYDNYAALAKPAGWNYAGDSGVAENMALAQTPNGVGIA